MSGIKEPRNKVGNQNLIRCGAVRKFFIMCGIMPKERRERHRRPWKTNRGGNDRNHRKELFFFGRNTRASSWRGRTSRWN